jgi:hypothetical protein
MENQKKMKSRSRELLTYAASVLVLFLGCRAGSKPSQDISILHPGEQWLSWSAAEKGTFVIAFLQGYGDGISSGCNSAEETLSKVELKDTKDNRYYIFDAADCRSQVPIYTKLKLRTSAEPDTSAYANVITGFYENYPQYRNIPYIYLMQLLKGENPPGVNELYSMAQTGKMITRW